MSVFPPTKANKAPVNPPQVGSEIGAVSTGGGGIPASLRAKAAGTVDAPGKEKTVQSF